MNNLRPLFGLLATFSLGVAVIGLSAPRATAADFCALTVTVSGPDGGPINSTWIELADPSGRIVRREMVAATFKICDFEFGPHTLRIGTNECLPVSVSNLQVVIGHPVVLNVVLNVCGYRETMRNACLIYFRTVGTDRQPVAGVEFSPQLTLDQPSRTDSFGRWQGLLGRSAIVTFSKPGHEPTTVRVECQRNEEVDLQVVMKERE
jgi:hypothetical protein